MIRFMIKENQFYFILFIVILTWTLKWCDVKTNVSTKATAFRLSHLDGANPAVRLVHSIQSLCDMIRNSIYRCYGIIPTIKEVFHLPSDLRLASQDTENYLIAMSFTVQKGSRDVRVCVGS